MSTKTAPSLAQMEEDVFQCNQANGWFEKDRTIGEDFALIHSEISEALEAYRSWKTEDRTDVLCCHGKFQADWDAHRASLDRGAHLCKPEGVGSELADIVVRILDTVRRRKVDLPWDTLAEVTPRPLGYETFGEHIDQLHALTSQRDLKGLLASVVFMADHAGLDLQYEFDRKLAYNRTRGHRHGGKNL